MYKSIILPAIEEHRLRGIFQPKMDEVRGGQRKMHYEEPRKLNSLASRIRVSKPG
jgi:hypothetical protein